MHLILKAVPLELGQVSRDTQIKIVVKPLDAKCRDRKVEKLHHG